MATNEEILELRIRGFDDLRRLENRLTTLQERLDNIQTAYNGIFGGRFFGGQPIGPPLPNKVSPQANRRAARENQQQQAEVGDQLRELAVAMRQFVPGIRQVLRVATAEARIAGNRTLIERKQLESRRNVIPQVPELSRAESIEDSRRRRLLQRMQPQAGNRQQLNQIEQSLAEANTKQERANRLVIEYNERINVSRNRVEALTRSLREAQQYRSNLVEPSPSDRPSVREGRLQSVERADSAINRIRNDVQAANRDLNEFEETFIGLSRYTQTLATDIRALLELQNRVTANVEIPRKLKRQVENLRDRANVLEGVQVRNEQGIVETVTPGQRRDTAQGRSRQTALVQDARDALTEAFQAATAGNKVFAEQLLADAKQGISKAERQLRQERGGQTTTGANEEIAGRVAKLRQRAETLPETNAARAGILQELDAAVNNLTEGLSQLARNALRRAQRQFDRQPDPATGFPATPLRDAARYPTSPAGVLRQERLGDSAAIRAATQQGFMRRLNAVPENLQNNDNFRRAQQLLTDRLTAAGVRLPAIDKQVNLLLKEFEAVGPALDKAAQALKQFGESANYVPGKELAAAEAEAAKLLRKNDGGVAKSVRSTKKTDKEFADKLKEPDALLLKAAQADTADLQLRKQINRYKTLRKQLPDSLTDDIRAIVEEVRSVFEKRRGATGSLAKELDRQLALAFTPMQQAVADLKKTSDGTVDKTRKLPALRELEIIRKKQLYSQFMAVESNPRFDEFAQLETVKRAGKAFEDYLRVVNALEDSTTVLTREQLSVASALRAVAQGELKLVAQQIKPPTQSGPTRERLIEGFRTQLESANKRNFAGLDAKQAGLGFSSAEKSRLRIIKELTTLEDATLTLTEDELKVKQGILKAETSRLKTLERQQAKQLKLQEELLENPANVFTRGAKRGFKQGGIRGAIRGATQGRAPGDLLENVALGAGFPLLFGGGPGSIAGGTIGSLFGKGFGGQILGGAIGQIFDDLLASTAQLTAAFDGTTDAVKALRDAGIAVSADVEKTVSDLRKQGKFGEAEQLVRQQLLTTSGDVGGVGTKVVGDSVRGLQQAWDGVYKAVALTVGLFASGFVNILSVILRIVQGIAIAFNAVVTGIAAAIGSIPGLKQLIDGLGETITKLTPAYQEGLAELDKQISAANTLNDTLAKTAQLAVLGTNLTGPAKTEFDFRIEKLQRQVELQKELERINKETPSTTDDQRQRLEQLKDAARAKFAIETAGARGNADQKLIVERVQEEQRLQDLVRNNFRANFSLQRKVYDLQIAGVDQQRQAADYERAVVDYRIKAEDTIAAKRAEATRAELQVAQAAAELQGRQIAQRADAQAFLAGPGPEADFIRKLGELEQLRVTSQQQREASQIELELRIDELKRAQVQSQRQLEADMISMQRQRDAVLRSQIALIRQTEDYKMEIADYQLKVAREIREEFRKGAAEAAALLASARDGANLTAQLGQSASGGLSPAANAMASFIQKVESSNTATGYNSINRKIPGSLGRESDYIPGTMNLPGMTVAEVIAAQRKGSVYAAGKYKIIPTTLASLATSSAGAAAIGYNDKFNAATQDKGFLALLERRIKPYLDGVQTVGQAAIALGNEWISLQGKSKELIPLLENLKKEYKTGSMGAAGMVVAGRTGGEPGMQSAASLGRSSGAHLHGQLNMAGGLEDLRRMMNAALIVEGNKTITEAFGRGVDTHSKYPGRALDFPTPQNTLFRVRPGFTATDLGNQGRLGRGMRVTGPGVDFKLGHLAGVETGMMPSTQAAMQLMALPPLAFPTRPVPGSVSAAPGDLGQRAANDQSANRQISAATALNELQQQLSDQRELELFQQLQQMAQGEQMLKGKKEQLTVEQAINKAVFGTTTAQQEANDLVAEQEARYKLVEATVGRLVEKVAGSNLSDKQKLELVAGFDKYLADLKEQNKIELEINRTLKDRQAIQEANNNIRRYQQAGQAAGRGLYGEGARAYEKFRDLGQSEGASTEQAALARQTDIRERVAGVREELNKLNDSSELVFSGADAISQAFGSAFQNIISGSQTAEEALANMFQGIAASFAQMAADMLAKQAMLGILKLFNIGTSAVGGGGTGDIFSAGGPVSRLFGYAEGGRPSVGQTSIVGENGWELFVPDAPGTIVPNEMAVPYMQGQAQINPDGSTTYAASYPGAPGAPGSRGASGIGGQGRAGNSPLPALTVPFQKSGSGDQTLIQNLTESFGRQLVEMGSIKVAMDTTVINGMEFVTPEQAQQGNQQAAQQGAKIALAALQNSVGTRRKIGL